MLWDSFTFTKDGEGIEYITMTQDKATMNHQGSISNSHSDERQTPPVQHQCKKRCISSLKIVHELNTVREAFFQKSKADFKFSFTDPFWYGNKPLGVNQLSKMMKEMCLGGKLSKTYTNHCYLLSHSGLTRAFQLITLWVFQAMSMSRGLWYFICR